MTTLMIVAILALLAVLEYLLPRFGPNWMGAILPATFAIFSIAMLITNGVDRFRDILLPLAGFFALLCIWGTAIEKKKDLKKDEMEKIDRQIV